MARQISVQSAAMTNYLRPVFFTASTTRESSQALIQVRSIGFWSVKRYCNPLINLPPRQDPANCGNSDQGNSRQVGTFREEFRTQAEAFRR
jgi:hypothetical protein